MSTASGNISRKLLSPLLYDRFLTNSVTASRSENQHINMHIKSCPDDRNAKQLTFSGMDVVLGFRNHHGHTHRKPQDLQTKICLHMAVILPYSCQYLINFACELCTGKYFCDLTKMQLGKYFCDLTKMQLDIGSEPYLSTEQALCLFISRTSITNLLRIGRGFKFSLNFASFTC